ncbi:MAG: septum site-determining protein MinC [Candidatus Methylumidiphilus sp.]
MPLKQNASAPSPAFEIKSGAVHLPVLKLLSDDIGAIAEQLRDKISLAPDFFHNAPMAIDPHELAQAGTAVDFTALARAMRACGLVPVGVCGEVYVQAAWKAGLPQLPTPRHDPQPAKPPEPKDAPAERHNPDETGGKNTEETASKLVELPVRSGQRIYAAGGDLVVLSQVSAGAEIMADGNIHVYGALRGRALAGVQGNVNCRIFCHDLQAELVAIGGHYKISENIDDAVRGRPVQIYLKDNALIIEKI